MNKRISFIFLCLAFSLFFFNAGITLSASKKVIKVEAVGYFGHPPLWKTRETIQNVCKQFGKQVELILHDEMAEDGQKFM